ncbi:MAG: DNA helicase RecQ [Candidatus Bruticola sp.]
MKSKDDGGSLIFGEGDTQPNYSRTYDDDFLWSASAASEETWEYNFLTGGQQGQKSSADSTDPISALTDEELEREAHTVLQRVFGYHSFRGPQKDIIFHVARGGSAVVLMPTGGGKSLCYQIPALLRSGVALVISPLIALMQDQVDALISSGVRAAFLNSSLEPEQARRVCAKLYAGELDLLYVSPERAIMDGFLNMLSSCRLSLIAIDEAHCVSQWGHDFRPEYVQLVKLRQFFPNVPWVALTATADEATRLDIINHLELQDAKRFVTSFDRPNIFYTICSQSAGINETRQRFISFIESRHRSDSGIVYCLSRKDTEETARWLCSLGYEALPYHAGMTQSERAANQARFLREEGVIMAATIAFGMGIDKPNVRFVAHFALPGSVEAYYQETGRAGRDGLPASAWLSYNIKDIVLRQKFIEDSEADENHKAIDRRRLRALLGICETVSCRRRALLGYFGEQLEHDCGHCDNCLDPPEASNGIIYAQKALSCVYRTGQMYGVSYLIQVLRGGKTERILARRHDKISTYAIGKELSAKQWTSVFRQLLAAGYLKTDMVGCGSVKLTKRSREILDGSKTELMLRIDSEATSERTRKVSKNQKTAAASVLNTLTGVVAGSVSAQSVSALFEILRRKRMELARQERLAPYMVLHDTSLLLIAKQRPRTLEELSQISGFGLVKLRKYGAAILAVVAEFAAQESKVLEA